MVDMYNIKITLCVMWLYFNNLKTFFMDPKYNCTQDALYEGGDLLAASLTEELLQFSFKAKYDALFVAAFKNQIKAARELPDDEERSAHAGILRVELKEYTDVTVKDKVNALRLYIRDAEPNPEAR